MIGAAETNEGLLAPLPAGSPFEAAIWIRHDHMAPEIRRGSVVFLAPPGYCGEGVYSIPFEGEHRGDLRRATGGPGGKVSLTIDAEPYRRHRYVVDLEWLKTSDLRRVVGIAAPFTADFAEFLLNRFGGPAYD